MKKILLFATLVLGVVSCMKDQSVEANLGGDGNFTLAVALPDAATRAAGNDSSKGAIGNIDLAEYDIRYVLEVFDASNELAKRLVQFEDDATSTVFEIRLVPGRDYNFVVWADFVKRDGQGKVTEEHYNVADLRCVSLSEDSLQHPMDESRDAYTGVRFIEKFDCTSEVKVELKRPFAKLRVVTNDMNELYSKLTYATVTYTKGMYTSFDALKEHVVGATREFTKAANFANQDFVYLGEPTKKGEMTLFADYLFGTEDDTIQFELDLKDNTGETIPTVYFNTTIPVERNYLTTIYGPILTDFNKVSVDIEEAFANEGNLEEAPYYQVAVTNGLECAKAFLAGQKFIALNDIVVTAEDIAKAQTRSAAAINPVCNLNGFTITFVNDSDEPLFVLPAGSSFTITGGANNAGEFVLTGEGTGAAIVAEEGATLNINGGTIKNEGKADFVFEANGETNIAGGNLEEGALQNNGEVNITDGNLGEGALQNNGETNISGGNLGEGAIENNGTTNITGDDAVVEDNAIENGEDGMLVVDGNQSVVTIAELQKAVNESNGEMPIQLGADIVGDVTVTQKKDVEITIDGNGKAFKGAITVDGKSATYTTAGLTLKNVVFNAEAISADACINLGVSGDNNTRYTCNVTVDNCTFDVAGAVGVKSYTGGDKNLVITNSIATSKAHSLVQAKGIDGIVVEKCTVNSKNGLNFNNSTNVTVDNCDVVVRGYAVRFGESKGGAQDAEVYTIKDCSLKSDCEAADDAVIVLRGTADNSTLTIANTTLDGARKVLNTAVGSKVIYNGDEYLYKGDNVYEVNGTDVYVATTAEAFKAGIEAGKTLIWLMEGEYNLPAGLTQKSGTLTIIGRGADKTILNGAKNSNANSPGNYANGVNVVFEGLTFKTANNGYNGGFGHAVSVTFRESKIVGQFYAHSNAPHYFYDCTIDPLTGYLYTYGSDCVFEGCTFAASEGKALQVYEDSASGENTVTISNCAFVAAKQATTWDGKPVTGIDINSNGAKFIVNINNCTTTGFPTGLNSNSDLWNVKDAGKAHVNVYVDGVQVWFAGGIAPGVMLNEAGEYLIMNATGMFWFANEVNVNKNTFSGKVVKLAENINLNNAAWTPIGQTGATQFKGTFDGNNKTISNLKMDTTAENGEYYSTGIFGWLLAAKVKNVTVDGASIKGNHNVATIAGYLEWDGCTVENCHVKNATIIGNYKNDNLDGDKCGAIVGYAGNANTYVKDCTATDCTVTASRDAGQIVGAGKEVNVTNCVATNVTVAHNGQGTGKNIRNEVIGRLL